MNTTLSRLNAIVFFALGALLACSAGTAVTAMFFRPSAVVNRVEVAEVRALTVQWEELRSGRRAQRDRATLVLNVDADLSGVFNWNVKQLWAIVTAQFVSPTNAFNEVVLWDGVVSSKEAGKLRLRQVLNKYPLIDQTAHLRGTPVNVSLRWDAMPTTGFMYWGTSAAFGGAKGFHTVTLPVEYCKPGQCGTTSTSTPTTR